MAAGLDEQAIFEVARRIGPADVRDVYLRQVCGDEGALEQRVRALLGAYAASGSFLEAPPSALVGEPGPTIDQPVFETPGTMIGPYKLLEQIGEGGFGVVFMAEQTEPVRRKVALKVLKPGMDTRQVVARFEAERQALALMDHPNIARVLDAGATASGRPFFVMELVRAVPITEYCDQNQLPTRQRLELFVTVCHAVQHAHQKGIIHRDLKPSNVLVARGDAGPVVKVIDFGVAKALGQELTEKTLFTGFAQMIGTPLYMSPEQAGQGGLDVDTRSDIYSLGVLLYELLTGTTPFDRDRLRTAAFDEIRRIIREEEPPRPSTRLSTLGPAAHTASANRHSDPRRLSQLLRGELDWVVMKALEKDRGRRYETASALAQDVQRYLADEPVLACPPSAVYRFRKFARRNRAALVAMSAAVLVALAGVAGLAVSNLLITREKERVVREKERGDRHLARVRAVMEQYLAKTAEDRRLKAAGLHDLRKSLLLSMVEILEEFAQREGDDRETRLDRGWALLKLGNVWLEVGNLDKALDHYDRAREIWDRLAADIPNVPGPRICRTDCDNNRGVVLTNQNRLDEAERSLRQALEAREQLAKEYPGDADHLSGIGSSLHSLSLVERRRGNKEEERRLLEQAIVRQEEAVKADPRNLEARTFLANHHSNLGVLLMELNKTVESEAAINQARVHFERLNADYPDYPEFRSGIGGCWNNLGNLYERDRPEESIKAYRQAAIVKDRLASEFPAVPDYRRDLAGVHQNIGLQLSLLGQDEEAGAEFDAALALREQLVKEHPKSIDYALELGISLVRRGCREADAGRFETCLKPLGRAIEVLEPLAGYGREDEGANWNLRSAHGARADALLRLGRHAEAVKHYDRALALDDGKMRSYFRVERAIALAYLKEHVKAAAEADAVAGENNLPAFLIQDAAAVHAVCSLAVRDDAKLSERYAARAVALLRRAFEKNYKAIADDVRRARNLDAIRSREDFKKLVSEFEGPKK